MTRKIVKKWTTNSGLEAIILLVRGSHHCGYVEVPEKLKNVDFYNCEIDVDVHGGVTYQNELSQLNGKLVIGFDCVHNGDKTAYWNDGVFRDEAFCIEQCESMASQLFRHSIGAKMEHLLKFLKAYLEWSKDTSINPYGFDDSCGLCKNITIMYHERNIKDLLTKRLIKSFDESDTPFGDEYLMDSRYRIHHLNPKRIAWVNSTIAELEKELGVNNASQS